MLADIGPSLAVFWVDGGRFGGQVWPNSGRVLLGFGRVRSKFGRLRRLRAPVLVEIGPSSADSGQILVAVGRRQAKRGRLRGKLLVEAGPRLVDGQVWLCVTASAGPVWSKSASHRSQPTLNWPSLGRCWSTLPQTWPHLARARPHSTGLGPVQGKFDPGSPKLGQSRQELGLCGQTSTCIPIMSAECHPTSASNTGDIDGSWANIDLHFKRWHGPRSETLTDPRQRSTCARPRRNWEGAAYKMSMMGDRPWPDRKLIDRRFTWKRALRAWSWPMLRFSGAHSGREAAFRGPDPIRRIGPGPPKAASRPKRPRRNKISCKSEP